jgi:hypothetical protein
MAEITVDGKTYPLRATMRAWRDFETQSGVKMAEIAEADVTRVPELLWHCAAAGCRKDKKEFDITLDEWMDAITTDDLVEMQETIQELLGVKKK